MISIGIKIDSLNYKLTLVTCLKSLVSFCLNINKIHSSLKVTDTNKTLPEQCIFTGTKIFYYHKNQEISSNPLFSILLSSTSHKTKP